MAKRKKGYEIENCVRKNELSYFDIPPIQDSIEKEYYQDVSSESTTPDARTLEFNIAGSTGVCLDLAKSYIKLKVKVVKADGSPLHATTEKDGGKVSVVNNLLHSLFSNIDVSLNDIFVSRSYSNYPYKAYIQNLLTYSKDSKQKGFLRCEGWWTDETGKYEDFSSKAIVGRRSWILNKSLELGGTLKCDLFQQHKLLPSQINVKIRCVRSDSNFALLDLYTKAENNPNKGSYKIVVENAVFRVKKVQLTHHEEERLVKEIHAGPFTIPVRRTDVTVHTISPGLLNCTVERIAEGQLPRQIFVAFVDSHAYNSEQDKNPFLFNTFDIDSVAMFVNGVMHPSRPYTPDFTNKHYVDSYLALCNAVGGWRMDHIPDGVSYEDFCSGACIFSFSVTPETNTSCDFVNSMQTGNISMEVKFTKAVPTNAVNAIIYSEYDNNIYINSSRQISTDYQ